MKRYKGWEIIKMLSEGKFKDETIIKSNDGYEFIVVKTFDGTQCLCRKREIAVVENSIFTNPDRTFYFERKKYNQLEAMVQISKGKKMTNSWLDNRGIIHYYYKDEKGNLAYTDGVATLGRSQMEADWYEFEEEQC